MPRIWGLAMSGSASTSSCRGRSSRARRLFYDPILTLTWVAAVTERVRLGTSVIVLPMRHPLPLAKELSTLHNLSGGRLILGVGVGWLEPEFAALGVPFNERGRRMDEGIAMMRAVWSQDPVTFEAKYIPAEIRDMTMLPQPVSPIPMWHGSRSEAAHRRTVRLGDGWHGSQVTPEQARPVDRTPAPRPPRARVHDLGPLALGRQGCRDDEGARRRLRRCRRAAHHGPPAGPRGRRLGHRDRRGRQGRGGLIPPELQSRRTPGPTYPSPKCREMGPGFRRDCV